ncbi:hypothetical protein KDA_30620 [Dictyobacter alpinus]|uniref:Uncharacterized protein n=1 Tax=Dictyobacter alpinus TaxID=2014873 RepID=A0A402B8A2_9CHLR|nr:hypothetical protein [Dictyobacter alpinus]GCE27578.1 hypothetical protein KDA_30620 [Dictyobacter alpinus]
MAANTNTNNEVEEQQNTNSTMNTEEMISQEYSTNTTETKSSQPITKETIISQETISGNIIAPNGDNQHVIINHNYYYNRNYYNDIIHGANQIAEQGDTDNKRDNKIEGDTAKSLKEDLAFEQRQQIAFTDTTLEDQISTMPSTEDEIATWFYELDDYEQHYVFTTAILHGAPAHIISKQAEILYKELKQYEITSYYITSSQAPAEAFSILPKQHRHSISHLRTHTHTLMRQSNGVACIYWLDTDNFGLSQFNTRVITFLSREFINKGDYGDFFFRKAKDWSKHRDAEYDYWLAAKSLGAILHIKNVQQLKAQAYEFAKQSSTVGYRRAASLLAGAYENEQYRQLTGNHNGSVLTIIDKWTSKIYEEQYNETKVQVNIDLGRTIAYAYSFIGRETPEIALKKTNELLSGLPIVDINCTKTLSSACVSTYISLVWSGHLRKVLHSLADVAEKSIDQWSATNNLKAREYERQQREWCIKNVNDAFFLTLAATTHSNGDIASPESYTQQIPTERIQIVELNCNIFISAIFHDDPIKNILTRLFQYAIVTAHVDDALSFLRNWAETVIRMHAEESDPQAELIYHSYTSFLIHLGRDIQKRESKWKQPGKHSSAISNMYRRHLTQWQKEGQIRNAALNQMASTVLQQISGH